MFLLGALGVVFLVSIYILVNRHARSSPIAISHTQSGAQCPPQEVVRTGEAIEENVASQNPRVSLFVDCGGFLE